MLRYGYDLYYCTDKSGNTCHRMAKESLDACCMEIPKAKKRRLEVEVESASSEDEDKVSNLPRQIRSWDEIRALYSQRCQGPVKRSMIMSGYSRKKTASLR